MPRFSAGLLYNAMEIMTREQIESVRIARKQLLDHNDSKTAALLDWAVTAEPSGWRPIETAPKDDTEVLLWEVGSNVPVIGSWYDRRERWCASTEHYNTDGDACVIDTLWSDGIQHWQPLPQPPEA